MKEEKLICQYCRENNRHICGKTIQTDDWKKTAGYHFNSEYRVDILEAFILKSENDKYAGLMINTGNGYRFVDIRYCPFCGRKIYEDERKRKIIKIQNIFRK